MYHSIREFITEWKSETTANEKIMEGLTDESFNKPLLLSIAHAWYLVWVIGSLSSNSLLDFEKRMGKNGHHPLHKK